MCHTQLYKYIIFLNCVIEFQRKTTLRIIYLFSFPLENDLFFTSRSFLFGIFFLSHYFYLSVLFIRSNYFTYFVGLNNHGLLCEHLSVFQFSQLYLLFGWCFSCLSTQLNRFNVKSLMASQCSSIDYATCCCHTCVQFCHIRHNSLCSSSFRIIHICSFHGCNWRIPLLSCANTSNWALSNEWKSMPNIYLIWYAACTFSFAHYEIQL